MENRESRGGVWKARLTPLMAVLFLLGFGLAVLYFAPLAPCPWCNGEIRHNGGLKRHCTGDDAGCDGSGRTPFPRRWESLLERDIWLETRR